MSLLNSLHLKLDILWWLIHVLRRSDLKVCTYYQIQRANVFSSFTSLCLPTLLLWQINCPDKSAIWDKYLKAFQLLQRREAPSRHLWRLRALLKSRCHKSASMAVNLSSDFAKQNNQSCQLASLLSYRMLLTKGETNYKNANNASGFVCTTIILCRRG